MKQKKVLLGMSGGVDSSVAALLLKKQGYKVIGAFMKNFSETKNSITGECSWIDERKTAQKIAAILKMPLITLDFEKEYKKKVIGPMFESYSHGFTPNPDTLCNKIIKFPLLWREAKKLKADFIATGHYARIKKTKRGFSLITGKDTSKDQSYFLHELNQKDLSHTIFPIGELTKEEVRNIAKKNKFPNWSKKGTSGICFVGKVDMFEFLKKNIKKKLGKVKTSDGKQIGIHEGIQFYTIGQRAGPRIGINLKKEYQNKKFYIADKNLRSNTLTLAHPNSKELKKKKLIIKNFHLINSKEKLPKNLKARIRHLGSLNSGNLKNQNSKTIFILKKPIEGIAEGQSIVLYSGRKLVAGGEIRLR